MTTCMPLPHQYVVSAFQSVGMVGGAPCGSQAAHTVRLSASVANSSIAGLRRGYYRNRSDHRDVPIFSTSSDSESVSVSAVKFRVSQSSERGLTANQQRAMSPISLPALYYTQPAVLQYRGPGVHLCPRAHWWTALVYDQNIGVFYGLYAVHFCSFSGRDSTSEYTCLRLRDHHQLFQSTREAPRRPRFRRFPLVLPRTPCTIWEFSLICKTSDLKPLVYRIIVAGVTDPWAKLIMSPTAAVYSVPKDEQPWKPNLGEVV